MALEIFKWYHSINIEIRNCLSKFSYLYTNAPYFFQFNSWMKRGKNRCLVARGYFKLISQPSNKLKPPSTPHSLLNSRITYFVQSLFFLIMKILVEIILPCKFSNPNWFLRSLLKKRFYFIFVFIANTKNICNLIGSEEYNIGRICTLLLNKKKSTFDFCSGKIEMYSLKTN